MKLFKLFEVLNQWVARAILALVGFLVVGLTARAASFTPLESNAGAVYGANWVLEYTASDLTTTTTNTTQVFTNSIVFPSNMAARLVWAQVVKPAVGPTNWTYSLLAQVGDSSVSNRYLSYSELASASGPDYIQFPTIVAQTGTPSATNGLVLPTVVTNIAVPWRDHTAATGLRVEFKPNAENSVSQATGVVYRLYWWLSPRGGFGNTAP